MHRSSLINKTVPLALSGASEQTRQANSTPIWRGGLPAIRYTKTQLYLTSPDFTRLPSSVKMNYIESVNFKLKKKKKVASLQTCSPTRYVGSAIKASLTNAADCDAASETAGAPA